MSEPGIPFLEYARLRELGRKSIAVRIPSERVETFGFLLGREMSAIGEGHGELGGRIEDPNDRWLASEAPEGWVAVVVVHDVKPERGLGRLTLHILGKRADARRAKRQLAELVARVRRAESEALAGSTHDYTWTALLGPNGEWANLNERARHRLGGMCEWPGLTIIPIAVAHEGQARRGALYREHRFRAYGTVRAPTWEFAQRFADEAAIRVALFMSVLLRTAIETRQAAASVVQGNRADLDRLFPVELVHRLGSYVSEADAFAQDYGPSAGWHDPQHIYRLPEDTPALWSTAASLYGRPAESFWSALAAYRTAWQLRYEHPSFGFVALVTAIEALIEGSALSRCECCGQLRGLGSSFRRTIAEHTGVPDENLKPITDVAYRRRSKTLHTGMFHGGELLSDVGRRGAWAPDPIAAFELREWDGLEQLVAATLLTWLRSRAAGRDVSGTDS